MRSRHPYKLYGAALLAVVAGLVALSVLLFDQAFTSFTVVSVHVQRAGLQLLPGSDVKVRGIIVGSVDSITSTGDGAVVTMKLKPDQAKRLPANVTVRMLPKTLFGEKYVDLVLPTQATGALRSGMVIPQDQTRATLEIDQALNDLLPLLRTVPPVELNHTLTALATALDGRGQQLGQTIEQLDTYLRGFNPQLPQLRHDMEALSGVTRTYADAADPLLRMLRNLTVTSNTVVDEKQQLSAFLADVTGAANATHDLLARNADNLVRVNTVNSRVISLLARYSPEFPCFFRGYAKLIPRIHNAVPKTPGLNHAAHVVVEAVPSYPTYSNPIDAPEFGDNRGPSCYGLPNPALSLPVVHYKDGTQDDPRFDTQGQIGKKHAAPARSRAGAGTPGSPAGPAAPKPVTTPKLAPMAWSPDMGDAGTAIERRMFGALLGPILGMDAMSVPDVADLLWGPIARGSAVSLS